MGVLGGEWLVPFNRISSYDKFELLTDIDVTFTMSGQTDTGLNFGASIDLDESDGNYAEGVSSAFDNRDQGGEEIYVSGSFGTLTMGDTYAALDWALKDIGMGDSLGDAHTSHMGYFGNDFVDSQDGDGQIARYDRSFGDFSFALSGDIAEAGGKDILSAGAKYDVALPNMRLGVGIGIGYAMDNWTFAANYSRITEEAPANAGQKGYGIAVNYDMGGGAEFQFGFSKSNCNAFDENSQTGGGVFNDDDQRCYNRGEDDSAFSLGVKMNF